MVIKEKVYLPDYMRMIETDFEYDLSKGLYRVDYGKWKPLKEKELERLRKQYIK